MDGAGLDPSTLFGLEGRVAIVTGASSGLGAAVARTLAAAGARVALVARRSERLAPLAAELGGAALPCDLLDGAQRAEVVPRTVEALGPPEILVAAAGGIVGVDPAEDEAPHSVWSTLVLNLIAPFELAQAAFPHLRDRGRGAVVFVSSISGLVGIPGIPQASYAASKTGLSGLAAELAVQWGRHGIRVNTVAPGFFRSEITEELYEGDRGAAWLQRNTPLPYEGRPEDVVGAVLWLASDAGRYVTGQTVVVDGGWTAR